MIYLYKKTVTFSSVTTIYIIEHNRSTTSGTLLCRHACILLLFSRSMHIVRLDKEDVNGRRNLA